jgi:D-arginine dehydrogenase
MKCDIAIIGGGMAGASLAAELAPRLSVLLLEGEDHPGYHSTGRSAAFWSETYGGPFVQPLTTASGAFLSERGFLGLRRGLHLAGEEGRAALAGMEAEFAGKVALKRIDRGEIEALVPGARSEWREALLEPTCADIDVAALHAFYLSAARRSGAPATTRARVTGAQRQGGGWIIETSAGQVQAEVLVNAAGAWADEVARLAGVRPLGIQPYRRTVVQLATFPRASPEMPLVVDVLGRFYFKPEAGGRLWVSPHDETPSPPCDCAAEEIDVALAVDRFEKAVDWQVERVERSWAGLRSFAPDRLPVYGFDPSEPGFFWFAGQGGFGIQTAPAAAALAAALILGAEPRLDPFPYRPGRFAN